MSPRKYSGYVSVTPKTYARLAEQAKREHVSPAKLIERALDHEQTQDELRRIEEEGAMRARSDNG